MPATRASVYAVTNHCSCDSDAFSAPARVGRATVRTVTSSVTAKTASTIAPSAHQRRVPVPVMATS